jgi:tight adherence protein B
VEQPLRDKLLMIHKLTEVGISLPNALATVAEDIDMAEFDFLVAAINAQLDSGGSITKSLRSIVDTLRARRNLKARVAALAAEGKMSAYILTCLPIGMFFYLQAVRPEYLAPLFDHPAALWILGGTALMIAFGFTAMLLIARIKV